MQHIANKKLNTVIYLFSGALILMNLICFGLFFAKEYSTTALEDRNKMVFFFVLYFTPGVLSSVIAIAEMCFCLVSFLSFKKWHKSIINCVCVILILACVFMLPSHIFGYYNPIVLYVIIAYIALRIIYLIIYIIEKITQAKK